MASGSAASKLPRRRELPAASQAPNQTAAAIMALPANNIDQILMLQRLIGNRATGQLLQRKTQPDTLPAPVAPAAPAAPVETNPLEPIRDDIKSKNGAKHVHHWRRRKKKQGVSDEAVNENMELVSNLKEEANIALENLASENATPKFDGIFEDWKEETGLPPDTKLEDLSPEQAEELKQKEVEQGGLSALGETEDARTQLEMGVDSAGTLALASGGLASFVTMAFSVAKFIKEKDERSLGVILEAELESLKTGALAAQTGSEAGKAIAEGVATTGNETAGQSSEMLAAITEGLGGLVPTIDVFLSGLNLVRDVMTFRKEGKKKKHTKREKKALALDSSTNALNAGKSFLIMARSTISAVQTVLDIASVASNLVSVVPFLGPALNMTVQFLDIVMQLIQLVRQAIRVHKQRIRAKQMRTMIAEATGKKVTKKYLKEAATDTTLPDEELLVVKLAEISKKRMKRAIRPMVVAAISTVADVASIAGSLLNIIGTATAPAYGAGVAIMAAGYGLSAGSSVVKLGASASKPIAAGIRVTKQGARNWVGNKNAKHFKNTRKKLRLKADGTRRHIVNTDKTSKKKHRRDVKTVERLFEWIGTLPQYSALTKSNYEYVYSLVKATGVDREALFALNGNISQQMKLVLKAIKLRE